MKRVAIVGSQSRPSRYLAISAVLRYDTQTTWLLRYLPPFSEIGDVKCTMRLIGALELSRKVGSAWTSVVPMVHPLPQTPVDLDLACAAFVDPISGKSPAGQYPLRRSPLCRYPSRSSVQNFELLHHTVQINLLFSYSAGPSQSVR
jgi:hypothetical protein